MTTCDCCHLFADKYVEYERILVMLDLLLHKPQVYRHMLFNINYKPNGDASENAALVAVTLWKMVPLYLLLDCYMRWWWLQTSLERQAAAGGVPGIDGVDYPMFDRYGTLVVVCTGEMVLYILGIVVCVKFWLRPKNITVLELVHALLMSSFAKLFVLLMMIWDYDLIFARLIDLFVLTSNVTAMRVFLAVPPARVITVIIPALLLRLVFLALVSVWDPAVVPPLHTHFQIT